MADIASAAGLTLDQVLGKGRKGKGSVALQVPRPEQTRQHLDGSRSHALVAAIKGNKAKREDFLIK